MAMSTHKSFLCFVLSFVFGAPIAYTLGDVTFESPTPLGQSAPDVSIFDNDDIQNENGNGNLAWLDGLSQTSTMPTTDGVPEFLTSSALDPSSGDLFADSSSSVSPVNLFSDNSSDDLLLANVGDLSSSSLECSYGSTNRGSRKLRLRTDASCNAGDNPIDPSGGGGGTADTPLGLPSFDAVAGAVYVKNRKKYCSQTTMNEFGNIPICDINPPLRGSADLELFGHQISLSAAEFTTVQTARISKTPFLVQASQASQAFHISALNGANRNG